MNPRIASRIVSAEKLSGGAVITFDDGVSALYSAPLLRFVLEHAEELLCAHEPPGDVQLSA